MNVLISNEMTCGVQIHCIMEHWCGRRVHRTCHCTQLRRWASSAWTC